MDGKIIRQIAIYIIDNHTIEEAAAHFHLSRSTIIKYTNLVRKPSSYYNYELAVQLNEAMERNSHVGKVKGGENGHKTYVIDNETAIKYAEEIIENGKTLREIADKYDLNVATLYNSLMRINDKEILEKLKEYYKKGLEEQRVNVWKR